jgi:tetratricopeptide (TPR) repeat protein
MAGMAAPMRRKKYDRARVLKRAAVAQRKRKKKKALALYKQVLADEPDNADLHRRVAALLASTGQLVAALASYRKASEQLVRKGFDEQAIGLLRSAVEALPREPFVCRSLAALEVKRGRTPDALEVLLQGAGRLRRRRHRPGAIQLLSDAYRIDPRNFPTTYALAGLLGRGGRRMKALRLLDEVAAGVSRKRLRQVRARQFRISPTPIRAWRLARACFTGR